MHKVSFMAAIWYDMSYLTYSLFVLELLNACRRPERLSPSFSMSVARIFNNFFVSLCFLLWGLWYIFMCLLLLDKCFFPITFVIFFLNVHGICVTCKPKACVITSTRCFNVESFFVTSNSHTCQPCTSWPLTSVPWTCWPCTGWPKILTQDFWDEAIQGQLVYGQHNHRLSCEASSWKLGQLVNRHVLWAHLSRGAHEHWDNLCTDNMSFRVTCYTGNMNIGSSCCTVQLSRGELR